MCPRTVDEMAVLVLGLEREGTGGKQDCWKRDCRREVDRSWAESDRGGSVKTIYVQCAHNKKLICSTREKSTNQHVSFCVYRGLAEVSESVWGVL